MTDPDLSPETIRKIEIELSKLDAAIQGMSLIMRAKVLLYEHHPARILKTQDNGISNMIQISTVLEDPKKGDTKGNIAFGFWVHAWQDANKERRLWHEQVAVFKETPRDFTEQVNLLQKCWDKLRKVTAEDLKHSIPSHSCRR